MNYIKYLLTGILFGIILTKAEVISWFRIQEMFRFESFHMYGVIGSAVLLGALGIWWIKHSKAKDIHDDPIQIAPKDRSWIRYIVGGTIFGLGWALSGACPGPMFILAGFGYHSILIVIAGATFGTLVYGWVRKYLPH